MKIILSPVNSLRVSGPASKRDELPARRFGPALPSSVTGGARALAPQEGPALGCQRYVLVLEASAVPTTAVPQMTT